MVASSVLPFLRWINFHITIGSCQVYYFRSWRREHDNRDRSSICMWSGHPKLNGKPRNASTRQKHWSCVLGGIAICLALQSCKESVRCEALHECSCATLPHHRRHWWVDHHGRYNKRPNGSNHCSNCPLSKPLEIRSLQFAMVQNSPLLTPLKMHMNWGKIEVVILPALSSHLSKSQVKTFRATANSHHS